ncbi:hypothetical protein WICPIJ_001520 [Wickerhamomyces pijperi]|uniref:Selenoprotein W-like protein n=1 Tax=Wickerhamomyces pijperi TaxID=599730 RepID=A0A9P8QDL6_WICPI|nr:hypothetical protein WICPIJ_001520 [Wickerhamomyces pijperi]
MTDQPQQQSQTSMIQYPRILIKFCTKCKWTLRSTWYQSELFQTFGESLGEVALQPSTSGTFQIIAFNGPLDSKGLLIWDRVVDGGFPDSKVLKRRVRDSLFSEEKLGHVDRVKVGEDGLLKSGAPATSCTSDDQDQCKECQDETSVV